MSVMIIGMNIPNCCHDCPMAQNMECRVTGSSFFWEDGTAKNFFKKSREGFDQYSDRLPNCPMIDMGRQKKAKG